MLSLATRLEECLRFDLRKTAKHWLVRSLHFRFLATLWGRSWDAWGRLGETHGRSGATLGTLWESCGDMMMMMMVVVVMMMMFVFHFYIYKLLINRFSGRYVIFFSCFQPPETSTCDSNKIKCWRPPALDLRLEQNKIPKSSNDSRLDRTSG